MSATILTLTLVWGLFYFKHIQGSSSHFWGHLVSHHDIFIMVTVFLIIVDVSFIIGFLITLNVFLTMGFLIMVTEFLIMPSLIMVAPFYTMATLIMVTNLFTLRGERVGTVPRVSTVSINCEDFQESFLTCSTCLCEYLIPTSAVLVVLQHR